MKQKVFFLRSICIILLFVSLVSCGSSKIEQFSGRDFIYEPQPDALKFNELWGYVMNGREKEFNTQIPLSDIVYFIAPISILSEVRQPATKSTFFGDFPGRVHIVSSCDSTAQAHLILDPTLPLREKIISGLVKAAETYDGLQIGWEYMPLADTANFHSFLRELKKQLGDKMLSVAVKARVRTIKNDLFDYKIISEIADKLIIMAYDEHWSTSAPGPIASNSWVKQIADYAATQIPPEKMVMGISFYGRTWTTDPIGSKAWYSSSMQRIIIDNKISHIQRDEDGIPYFTNTHKVSVTGYYDDIPSLLKRCKMCSDLGVNKLAFWRIGFEDVKFWQHMKLNEPFLNEINLDEQEHSEDIEYAQD
ncbi:MAG: glycoside hydrolase [Treponema sp.]|nr:glycoside hydrolase [Treponema sp.]